jgi:hypothetical protein
MLEREMMPERQAVEAEPEFEDRAGRAAARHGKMIDARKW